MNNIDNLGAQWFDIGVAKKVPNSPTYVSMPFTGISSPVGADQALPLIKHEIAAGTPFRRQQKQMELHDKFLRSTVSQWGPSSPHAVDWAALTAATTQLVDAVVRGDIAQVQEALRRHADPNTTVSVLDPNEGPTTTKYITVPIGVAAVLRGQEIAKQSGDKTARQPYHEIAALLLNAGPLAKGSPSIVVGNHPDGQGSAFSYQAYGIALADPNAGADSVERRVVAIPLEVRSALGTVAPQSLVDGAVPASTSGLVWGEELPPSAQQNYMDILDTQVESLTEKLRRFRERRAQNINPTLPPIPAPKR